MKIKPEKIHPQSVAPYKRLQNEQTYRNDLFRSALCLDSSRNMCNMGRRIIQILNKNNTVMNINQRDNTGTTLLMYAATAGQLELVHYLVETCHADVTQKDDENITASQMVITDEVEDQELNRFESVRTFLMSEEAKIKQQKMEMQMADVRHSSALNLTGRRRARRALVAWTKIHLFNGGKLGSLGV